MERKSFGSDRGPDTAMGIVHPDMLASTRPNNEGERRDTIPDDEHIIEIDDMPTQPDLPPVFNDDGKK